MSRFADRWNVLVVLAACVTIASLSTTVRAAESFEEKFRVVDRAGLPVSGVPLRACAIKWPSLDCVSVLAVAKSGQDGTLTFYIPDYLYHGGFINVEFTDADHGQLVLFERRFDKYERGQPTYRDVPATAFAVFRENFSAASRCSAYQRGATTDRYEILAGRCGMPRNLTHF